MIGCGPSKAEIEAQRRADSARIVDSVRAVERQRIDDSLRIAAYMENARITDSIREANTMVLEKLMKMITQTFNNSSANSWMGGKSHHIKVCDSQPQEHIRKTWT